MARPLRVELSLPKIPSGVNKGKKVGYRLSFFFYERQNGW